MNRCDERLGDTVLRKIPERAAAPDIEESIEVFRRHLVDGERVGKLRPCRLVAFEPPHRLGLVV
jgi:hypothetical protein